MLIDRRRFLVALPAVATTGRLLAQGSSAPAIRVRALNQIGLAVSDPQRSLTFYQELLGVPVQARQGATTFLRVGNGPQFLSISAATSAPGIDHLGFAVENYDATRLLQVLERHGVRQSASGATGARPLTVERRVHSFRAGDTEEIYLSDPDGIIVQLQDASYCGGTGPLGNGCAVEPSPHKGLLPVKDVNHFTINVADPARSRSFYQNLFGFGIRAYQGPTPTLAVGSGTQFIVFNTGSNSTGQGNRTALVGPARVHHACLTMEHFELAALRKTLEGYGLREGKSGSGAVPPLHYYVSVRLPDRGGAPQGTPELYVTDPDGIPIQLQDVSYCGGSGVLGERCS